MRTIKFRGKLISDDFRTRYKNGWIYGDYLKNDTSHFIINEFDEGSDNGGYPSIDIKFWQKVIPETVSQFTGFYDSNGKEIYEGDIVEGVMGRFLILYDEIVGEGYGFQWRALANSQWESMTGFIDEYEVVGNVHDNPELLEREGN